MKNPLAQYAEMLAEAIKEKQRIVDNGGTPGGYSLDFMKGLINGFEQSLQQIRKRLPSLENLITWTEGCPMHDGEYLVEFEYEEELHISYIFYNDSLGVFMFENDTIFHEEIRKHAKLKLGDYK